MVKVNSRATIILNKYQSEVNYASGPTWQWLRAAASGVTNA